MAKRRRYTAAERAIHYACGLGGLSWAETNNILESANLQPVAKSSYEDFVVPKYVPRFREDSRILGQALRKALSLGGLGGGTPEGGGEGGDAPAAIDPPSWDAILDDVEHASHAREGGEWEGVARGALIEDLVQRGISEPEATKVIDALIARERRRLGP